MKTKTKKVTYPINASLVWRVEIEKNIHTKEETAKDYRKIFIKIQMNSKVESSQLALYELQAKNNRIEDNSSWQLQPLVFEYKKYLLEFLLEVT